jgi:hypothetical protein
MGKFTMASLTGTYAFTTSGEVFTNGSFNPTPLARVGSFVADGAGHITGGTEDVNTAGTPSGATAIAGGSYTINADGRGTLTFNFQSGNSINFGIVLTSGSNGSSPATDGIMIDETSTQSQASTGSGNFILQNTAVCSSPVGSVAGTYVFDFSGLDSSGFPESFIGEFTANNSGATTANFADLNDDFSISNGSFTASFGTDGLNPAGPNACGRGLAQIVTGSTTETYAYYVVDTNRMRFINSAGGEMLSGDAVLQTGVPASLSGGFAFLVAGANQSRGGITRVGRFSASGSSVSNSSVLMDTNDSDSFKITGGSGGSSVSGASVNLDTTTGRGTLTFTDSSFNAPSMFVFYLTSSAGGVIQETSQVNGLPIVVADGSIEAQSGNPFTSSNITGAYAMNWSGLVTAQGAGVTDEEDLAGLVTVSNLSLSGGSDMFQFTSSTLSPVTNILTTGQINLNGGTGAGDDGKRVDMTVNLSGSQVDMVVYIVSPQSAFFENRLSDSGRTVAGILKAQQ